MNRNFFNDINNLIFQIEFVCENYISSVKNPELDNTCSFIAVLLRIIDKFKSCGEVDVPDFVNTDKNSEIEYLFNERRKNDN